MARFLLLASLALCTVLAFAKYPAPAPSDEFVGPFPSWANVKTDFGAVGDGKADDTAAIQQGLDTINPTAGNKKVLYFPAGVYRITGTLNVLRAPAQPGTMGMSILGEDPATTIIKWDGPQGGNMLYYCPWYSRIGRLTLDGNGAADTALFSGKPFVTYNQISDMVFKDVQFGIQAGEQAGIAETAVLRCKFIRCAKMGVSIQNFNSLDWWLWDCEFIDCNIGVSNTNNKGGGNFNVYRSIFRRSKTADMTIGHTCFFGIRYNTSIDSKAFFIGTRPAVWTDAENWGAQAALQGNVIIDPLDAAPIHIASAGSTTLLDNIIKSRSGVKTGPVVVQRTPGGHGDLLAAGNTFTVKDPLSVAGRCIAFDNKISKVSLAVPVLPATPLNRHRQVFEVLKGATAADIQALIDAAAKLNGKRPVVHFPFGSYQLDNTLVIPPNCDVQLVGDGAYPATQLTGVTPSVRITGPSHATIREIAINGLLITQCDQPGARIYGDEVNVGGAKEVCLLSEGLDHARVLMHDLNHGMSKVGVRVIGGPLAAQGKPVEGIINIFSGASAGNKLSYEMLNGGRLLARDIWYESGYPGECFARMTDQGEFTLDGAMVALMANEANPIFDFNNFRGKITVIGACPGWDNPKNENRVLQVKGDGAGMKLLLLGMQARHPGAFWNTSPNAKVAFLNNRAAKHEVGTILEPNQGIGDPAFLREMLATTRTQRPEYLTPIKEGITDIRLFRVNCSGAIGLQLKAGE
ncbi:MAG: glycosyl hydrolase family 28-related protein [Armatimonadota bacterium]